MNCITQCSWAVYPLSTQGRPTHSPDIGKAGEASSQKNLVFALVHQVRFGSDDFEVSFGAFGVDGTGFAV